MMVLPLVAMGMALVVGAAAKPHVVMAICDDCGWADVGYHGSDFPTPNIDELAHDGVRLDRFYAQYTCTPTRTAAMTGRYPFNTGTQLVFNVGTTDHLSTEYTTFGQAMSAEGYSTHYIGKWHLGYASYDYFPTNRGFDSFVGYMQGRNGFYDHTSGSGSRIGLDFWNNTELYTEADGVYSNTVFLQEVTRVVDQAVATGEPSFLMFSPASVHVILEYPPANYTDCDGVSPDDRHKLCNMVGNFDEAIGSVVQAYQNAGIWDDTLMIFFSDNGGATASGGSASSNHPLRGGKVSLLEGGVRTVGFVAGGDNVIPDAARGSIKTHLMHVVDLLPTVFSAAGLPSTNLPAGIDGVSQWATITDPSDTTGPRDEIPLNIFSGGARRTGIIVGEWKLIVGSVSNDGYWTIAPYDYVEPPTHGAIDSSSVFLFNIYDDPTEQSNLASKYPTIVADMQSRIAAYMNTSTYSEATSGSVVTAALPENNDGAWLPFLD